MKFRFLIFLFGMASMPAMAADHNPKEVAKLYKFAKFSLMDGIVAAEKEGGVVTSATFEIVDGKLMLRVYSVPDLDRDPENTTLTQFTADSNESPIQLEKEVITDKIHVARAAVHMTLAQIAQLRKLDLRKIIQLAKEKHPGQPIDAGYPMVRDGRPISDIVLIDGKEKTTTVRVDLLTGQTAVRP